MDVVEVDDQTTPDLLKTDLLAKLDLSKVPNISELDKSMYDDHRVGYWQTEQAFVYNVDRFREAGMPPPKRYSDLANPKLAGRVVFPDIGHYSSTYALLSLAYENGGDEANTQPGFDVLAQFIRTPMSCRRRPLSSCSSPATYGRRRFPPTSRSGCPKRG